MVFANEDGSAKISKASRIESNPYCKNMLIRRPNYFLIFNQQMIYPTLTILIIWFGGQIRKRANHFKFVVMEFQMFTLPKNHKVKLFISIGTVNS